MHLSIYLSTDFIMSLHLVFFLQFHDPLKTVSSKPVFHSEQITSTKEQQYICALVHPQFLVSGQYIMLFSNLVLRQAVKTRL